MTDHVTEELKRYAQIIEHDGIDTQEIYELMGLLYKAIGVLKEQDKKIEELIKKQTPSIDNKRDITKMIDIKKIGGVK